MQSVAFKKIDSVTLKKWLHDGQEIALLDVREHGQYGQAHLFYVASTPYSKLETEVDRLVQRKNVRMVLVDQDESLAQQAAKKLVARGYTDIQILRGGVKAWSTAGYELFAGVNLPSKTFGELAEHAFNTPRISAQELNQKIMSGEDLVILDGRPFTEYKKMSIPTAICCPNGELPLRIDTLVKDIQTTIVINCAGRTRSIIGAQTLINLGIKNKILALENGTQGWTLAGLMLEHDQTRRHALTLEQETSPAQRERATKLALKHAVTLISKGTLEQWMKDTARTTFLCDVRTPEEFADGSLAGAINTPGGQLVQATDQFIGVRGARIVLCDDDGVRAPAMSSWLAMMGWEVAVLENAFADLAAMPRPANVSIRHPDEPENIPSSGIDAACRSGAQIIDVRSSMKYRQGHLMGARWSIRQKLREHIENQPSGSVIVISDEKDVAYAAVQELKEAGVSEVRVNMDQPDDWLAAGLKVQNTPEIPPDRDCIDYLFFVHDRHDGNHAAALAYLAWETNLLNQIDEQELNSYKLPQKKTNRNYS